MNELTDKKVYKYFVPAVFCLTFYFLLYLPVEFVLTEVLFLVPKVNPWISTTILFSLVLMINLFGWEKILRKRQQIVVFVICALMSFVLYGFYHHEKLAREYLPKIYSVTPSWAIQGEEIKIRGVNFGSFFESGEVFVDEENLLIKHWSKDMVIAMLPVTSKTGKDFIFIKNKNGVSSNLFPFEIKDPDELRKFLE